MKNTVTAAILSSTIFTGSAIVAAETAPPENSAAADPAKPNIVFVLLDDMGWKDLGCFGAKIYETPNIDRLCADGVKFTQAYTPISICSPARASMMTGKHPLKLGIWSATHHINPKDAVILPSFLKNAGYQTWHVGKWHMGCAQQKTLPEQLGFDINIGGSQTWATGSYWWPYNQRHKGHPFIGVQKEFAKRGKKGDYLTDTLTDEAIGLLQKRDKNKPFYLNFWHYAVHEEHDGKPELVEKYKKKIVAAGLKSTYRLHPKTGTQICTSETDPVYAAMIESVDQSVGRLVEALKNEGAYDNTLILFYSDNGPTMTCAPLAGGKTSNYEGGIREPAFAVWTGRIKPGTTYDKAVYLPDLFDTILEAAQVSKPKNYDGDGVSWLPIFAGKELAPRKFYYYFPINMPSRGGVAGAALYNDATGMKYILNLSAYGDELFNLRTDIGEERNLIKEQSETAEKMNQDLCEFLRKYYNRQIPSNKGMDANFRKRIGL